MKFLFTADLHFSRYSSDKIVSESGLPERLDSLVKTLNNIFDYARKNNIKDIVVGGDLLHDKSLIYSIAQDCLLKIFRENQDLNYTVISGNHDLNSRGVNAFSALRTLDNEKNINRIKGDSYHDKENDILYVPYSSNMVNIIKTNSAKFLISHMGVNEGVLNSGISIVSSISIADFQGKYKYVLLGHYHKPQDIINDVISAYYVGSPIQLNFGEKNEEKRFLEVDTDSGEIKSIKTEGYKKYLEYKITDENKENINEIIQMAKEEKLNGNYVKIVKETSDFNVKSFNGIDDINIIDKTEQDITNRGISSNMTQRELLIKYLEIKGITEKGQVEKYLNVALSVANSI